MISTIAGSGATGYYSGSSTGDGSPATMATVNLVTDLAVDGAGNLYMPEYSGHRVRKVAAGVTLPGPCEKGGTPILLT